MSTSNKIRVMIVDDHGMVRLGLAAYLRNNPDMEVVGEARNGQEAIRMCEQTHPDVILMDLVMPELNGVAATRIINKKWPQVQVIAHALVQVAAKKLGRGTAVGHYKFSLLRESKETSTRKRLPTRIAVAK